MREFDADRITDGETERVFIIKKCAGAVEPPYDMLPLP